MTWLSTICREVFGLFVDDGRFAGVILVWLVLMALVLPHLGLSGAWKGVILFAGLAVLLVVSTAQRAGR